MLSAKSLLAKSYEGKLKGAYTLAGHTAAVMMAAEVIDPSDRLLHVAAWLHDWGKANSDFQKIVRKKLHGRQLARHEILTGLIALHPPIQAWLRSQLSQSEFTLAMLAGMSHHRKLGGRHDQEINLSDLPAEALSGSLTLYVGSKDFSRVLNCGRPLGFQNPPTLTKLSFTRGQLEDALFELESTLIDLEQGLNDTELERLAHLRCALIAADIAGSASPENCDRTPQITQWLNPMLVDTLTAGELEQMLAAQRVNKRISDPKPFQQQLGDSRSRVTVVTAGCGGGKTYGAYLWAEHHAVGKRIHFGYPTTGTASEGYVDYGHHSFCPVESRLTHSRVPLDLEIQGCSVEEIIARTDAIERWGAKLQIGTADSILGLLTYARTPVYNYPALQQGAFVFDEIHSYGSKLFGLLLQFLKRIKAPILLMTATLSQEQRQAIAEAVGEPINWIDGDPVEEARERYLIQSAPNNLHLLADQAMQAYQSGGKVLWVVNRVDDAVAAYKRLQGKALLYHSRFRYCDRLEKHKAVIDAFKQPGPAIAVTTQVCEMSLDLSADLLISQICPVASLVQRLGRLNRRYSGEVKPALVYPAPPIPYSEQELGDGWAFVHEIKDRSTSQTDLASAAVKFAAPVERITDAQFLRGGWRCYSESSRDPGYTLDCFLAKDVPKIKTRQDQIRYALPVLGKRVPSDCEKFKYRPVLRDYDYSPETGGCDQLLTEN